jgi:hypothetical protein
MAMNIAEPKFGNVQRAVKHKVSSGKISRRRKLGKCPDFEWLGTALRDSLKPQDFKNNIYA